MFAVLHTWWAWLLWRRTSTGEPASPSRTWFAVAVGLAALLPVPSLAQGIHAALLPADSTITPGTDFVVRLRVTQAGAPFNGYETVVSFDPTVLQFVSGQQGSYMIGACPAPPFHVLRNPAPGVDSIKVTNVILCGGLRLPGPGLLYLVKFHALNQLAPTNVRIRSIRFTDGGINVTPVQTSDAFFWIGNPSGVGPQGVDLAELRLGAFPVPFSSATSIRVLTSTAGPQLLCVYDVVGRCVRRLQDGAFAAGTRQVTWDGRDDHGATVASGTYLVHLESSGTTSVKRVLLIK